MVLIASCTVACESILAAQPLLDPELCPIATKRLNRSVGYGGSGNVIKAPVTPEETAALLETVRTGEGKARTAAIMQLALAGDLDTFRLLLGGRDADGLYIYSSQYLNRDGTVCIDPELERELLEHVRDPKLGRSLVALLSKNSYRDKAVLNALTEIPFDPARADQWRLFAQGVTSSQLPGIESGVLVYARSLLPLTTPIEKRVLPGLHRHYVKFFTQRGYTPAVAYFNELLVQASREEAVQNFQIEYGMLRTVVQRGLAALDDAGAHSALVGELEAIASKPLDPYANNELYNICELAPSLTDPSDRDAVVDLFARVLVTPQPAQYQMSMRTKVYETLGKLDSPKAEALLMAELKRYASDDPPPHGQFMVAKLFEVLGQVEDLDTGPLLTLADDLEPTHGRRMLWHLVSAQPSVAGVDYLLAELRLSYSDDAEVRGRVGKDASATLLKMLSLVQGSENQNRARDGLDVLFDQGVLPERDYVTGVTRLNKALGNESSRYVAYREELTRRRAAEKAASVRAGRRAGQTEYAEALVRNSTAEAIARNVALLAGSGGEAKRAFQWLVIVGAPALPQLHTALAAADTTDRHKVQLMNAMGEIGSAESITPVIDAAATGDHVGLYRPAFFALALMPMNPESVAFSQAQLVDEVAEVRQMAALVYLAQVRHAPSASFVPQFTQAGLPPRVRTAGFYLGARLGEPGMAERIGEALTETTDRSVLETLLQSLASAADSSAQFEQLANAAGFTEASHSYRGNLAYCAFRTAPEDPTAQKVELASRVLADSETWHRREAMRYLIATDPQGTVTRLTGGVAQFMPLPTLLAQSTAVQLLFSEGRRMGYTLDQTESGYELVRR